MSRSIAAVSTTSPADLAVAVEAAQAAAAVVRAGFGNRVRADMKGLVDPVTEVDVAAERTIVEILHAARPADAILAEEGGGATDSVGRRWIVDPLDGTVNYVHGIPQIGVSVALYDGDRGLAAAVVDVVREETFTATNTQPAELDGARIEVSTPDRLIDSIIGTGFPYDRDEHGRSYAATVGAVLERARGVRRMGAAVIDLAWVACGRLDGFWEFNLAPWDVAAGLLLVERAGGVATDLSGARAQVDSDAFVLSSASIAAELLSVLNDHRPPHLERTS